MRTITTETTIYMFDELPDESKDLAIENYRDINVDHDWYDFSLDYHKERLEKIGFTNAEIHFSGFWSQGDGACFDAHIDIITILNNWLFTADNYRDARKYQRWLILAEHGLLDNAFNIAKNSYGYHYSHERTRYIDIYFVPDCLSDSEAQEVAERLESMRLDLSQEIYKSLESEYDYLTSDEIIAESLIINEYEFTEDGKIY